MIEINDDKDDDLAKAIELSLRESQVLLIVLSLWTFSYVTF